MPLRRINFQTAGSSMLLATMASVAIVFPLLGMMGFSLFASLTILLLASPLSLLFSPVLLPAAIVLAGAVVAFSSAALLAVAGLSAFAWIYRSFKKRLSSAPSPSSEKPQIKVHDFGKGTSMVTEAGEVKGPSATFVKGELQTGKVNHGSVHDFGLVPSMVTESGEVKGPSATFANGELQTGKVNPGSVHDFGKGPSMVTESGEVKGPSATFVNGELQTGKVNLGSF